MLAILMLYSDTVLKQIIIGGFASVVTIGQNEKKLGNKVVLNFNFSLGARPGQLNHSKMHF